MNDKIPGQPCGTACGGATYRFHHPQGESSMNQLAQLWAIAFSTIKASSILAPSPNSNRVKVRRVRGYFVNGQRVYYRPAARWSPNVKGMRYVRDDSKGGIKSKLVAR